MIVYVARHGEAVSKAATDAERPLTERGRAEVMAHWKTLKEAGVRIERLVASPYRRAQQTALAIAQVYGGMEQEACGFIVPEARPGQLFDWLLAQDSCEGLVLVSHMPFVSHLVGEWTGSQGARFPFSVGAVAQLDVEVAAADGARLSWIRSPGEAF